MVIDKDRNRVMSIVLFLIRDFDFEFEYGVVFDKEFIIFQNGTSWCEFR